jgi:phytoene dehydrogenase-like protein
MGGMGAITNAMAKVACTFGAEIRTSSPVQQIDSRGGRARAVVLEDGTEIRGRVFLSNADPKRTFLGMIPEPDLPADFVHAIRGIKMNGPCAKVNMVLAEEPRFSGTPASYDPQQRSLFTLVPSLDFAERCYDIAKFEEIPEQLWVDCVIASNTDPSLAPAGTHVMTCFVQYVPYKLRQGSWDGNRELHGDRVVKKVTEYAPNVPVQSLLDRS